MVDRNSEAIMLGKNQIEDVLWLCSLSETELDMLIWIKRMALHRAKKVGHISLAREFDLKTLRSLSLTVIEHLMDQVNNLSILPSYAEALKQLHESNLLRSHVNDDFSSMSSEELFSFICPEKKKRIAEMFADHETPRQRRRNVDGESSHHS